MFKFFSICACLAVVGVTPGGAQGTASSAKPTEHLIGTVTKVDPETHTVTVKEDKTGTEDVVLLENTKTLLKVPPGAKDLKSATRITAEDLQAGDRVDVRGSKPEDTSGSTPPNTIEARSVVLMSGRDLAQSHQAEAAAWQHSTAGVVTSVDGANHQLNITVRTPEGQKPLVVDMSPSTAFTRYSPATPNTPVPSQLTDIQPGDQVRIVGEKSGDGATLSAQRVYSGAFRTIAGTVAAIAPDGKQLTVKDLQSKESVQVMLTEDSAVRKLPPMLAMQLARRFNPDFKGGQGGPGLNSGPGAANGGNAGGAPPYGAKAGEAAGPGSGEAAGGNGGPSGAGAGRMRAGNGDLSQILERLPKMGVSDLKAGDAVVISGVAQGADKSHLLASSIIAGVEPIFQSAPPRQGQSLGDWSLDMQAPAQQ